MALQFDYCENRESFKYKRSLNSKRATISFYVQTPNKVVNIYSVAMNLVACMYKDEIKRENISLIVTLNNNPRSVQHLEFV